MAKQNSIKLNFIMNSILTMSQFIFPLITFPYISRILLATGTGKISFASSVISYFALFAQLGIPTYGIRACAQVRDDKEELTKTAHEIFFINFVCTAFTYSVFIIALLTVPRLQQDKTLFLITSLTLLFNAIGMNWLYQALEQYTYITVRSLVFKVISVGAMFLFVHEQNDYVIYGAISVFASSASNIFNFINLHRFIGMRPNGSYNFKQHIKPIFIFFAMACATTIYTNLDTVMLGFMKTDADVGYYDAAIKIKKILVSIVTSMGTVLLPRASYYIENNFFSDFRRLTDKAINFVWIVATPLVVYFIFYAKEGIILLSGDGYLGSIVPMQIIMPTVLLIGLSDTMGVQILVPLGKEKIVLQSVIAGAIVDLIINWLLIPSMASAGAAIGTLVAEVVVTVWQYVALRESVRGAYRRVRYLPISLGISLGTAASIWIKTLEWPEFLSLTISAILFFGIYALVLTLAKEPLTLEIEKLVLGKLKNKLKRSS